MFALAAAEDRARRVTPCRNEPLIELFRSFIRVTRRMSISRPDIGNESAPIQLAGSLGWPFPALKYKYVFRIKYTEAIFVKQHSETVMV